MQFQVLRGLDFGLRTWGLGLRLGGFGARLGFLAWVWFRSKGKDLL